MTAPADAPADPLAARREAGSAAPPPRPGARIVGCGRAARRDDQAGLRVAELLADWNDPAVAVATTECPSTDLICGLENVGLLVITDAILESRQCPVGRWTRIEYGAPGRGPRVAAPRGAAVSAHTLDVNAALRLGRELGLLPPRVWLYVVAGENFGYGDELSPQVEQAVPQVAARIRADVTRWLAGRRPAHA